MEQHGAAEEAVRSLRSLILAGERYRQVQADHVGLGVTEGRPISYLTVHGDRGQNELAADLGLSSGASTALVDRLERQGIAERYPHPSDRRRTLVRLTARGRAVVEVSRQWLLAAFHDVPPGPPGSGRDVAVHRRAAVRPVGRGRAGRRNNIHPPLIHERSGQRLRGGLRASRRQ